MKITKEQLKQIIKEELEMIMQESPLNVKEIDEIIERNMEEGTVDQAVYELDHYTANQIAEYAGILGVLSPGKNRFIQAIEREMERNEY